jgi:hypothetical protein
MIDRRIKSTTIHHIYTKLTNWKQCVRRKENSTGLKKAWPEVQMNRAKRSL